MNDINIKCCICHKICLKEHHYVQLELFKDVLFPYILCSKCKHEFTGEDLNLMMNLFMLYGGYFGKNKLESFSLVKSIHEVITDERNIKPEQMNIRLMHRALLHGISPKDYMQKLQQLATSEVFP